MNKISKTIFIKLIVLVSMLVSSCFPGGDVISNLTLFAGQQKATANGALVEARFSTPLGIVADDANHLYVTEPANHVIRKISSTGTITTYAGKAHIAGATNGNINDATFTAPSALAFDKTKKILYVSDFGNSIIRRIDATGTVSTLTGQVGAMGFQNGNANVASLNLEPTTPLVIDSKGNLYLPDNSEYVIRKITPTGEVSTYAGIRGQYGNLDGQVNSATISSTRQMVVDSNDNILITTDKSLRKISPNGVVTTIFTASTELDKYFFASPTTLTIDSNNNLYAYGAFNENKLGLLKMAPNGQITPFFEIDVVNSIPYRSSDSTMGIFLTVDSSGNVFLADVMNSVIRKFQPNGIMVNIGKPVMGSLNSNNGVEASFAMPKDFAIDQSGNILVTDSLNNMLRKVTPLGQVSKLSGGTGPVDIGLVNGNPSDSRFYELSSIAYNSIQNNLYVVDQLGKLIRKVFADGSTLSFAGGATQSFQDGNGVNANFNRISAITMNPSNTFLFTVDGNRIRKVDMNGVVSTVYNPDSNLLGWEIDSIVADLSDNVFVVSNGTLYKISTSGVITAIYRHPINESINLLGLLPTPLTLQSVKTIDTSGNFYLQFCAKNDSLNECEIRKLNIQSNTLTSTGVKANSSIKTFKFDSNGQAYALVDNALFKANLNN